MFQRISHFVTSGVAISLLGASVLAAGFHLKNGDRVVFYGDSITQDGGYGRLVEDFVHTRFPEWQVRFFYAGVGGDRVSGGGAGDIDVRLERDVIALRPTVVTIMLGMNDGGYTPFDQARYNAYCTGYRKIVSRLKTALPGVRLTLIQTSPFDDISRAAQFPGGYDAVLQRYSEFVAQLAREEKALVADLGNPVRSGIARLMDSNAGLARMLVADRVHPGGSGHLIMGAALLRAWNAPVEVSSVHLDAQKGTVSFSSNTAVADLKKAPGGLSWNQADRAFPLPLRFSDADVQLAEDAGAGLDALNRQVLRVTGLAPGKFRLSVDDQAVCTGTAAEWAEGINLAHFRSPMLWESSMPVTWDTSGRQAIQTVRREVLVASGQDKGLEGLARGLEVFETTQYQEAATSRILRSRAFRLEEVR